MCGLVGLLGVYTNGFMPVEMDAIEHSLVLNSFRGADSTGLVGVDNKGSEEHLKVLGNSFNLLADKDYSKLRSTIIQSGRFIFGHGRKATFGETSVENAHPFHIHEVNEAGKEIMNLTLIHNGTLERGSNEGIEKFDVDSHWMADKIAKQGAKSALEEIHGAIATMWYDKLSKNYYIFRNKDRPLYHVSDKKGNIYINSEAAVFHYLKQRFNIDLQGKIESFQENVLYTVSLDFEVDKPWKRTTLSLPKRKNYSVIPSWAPSYDRNKYSRPISVNDYSFFSGQLARIISKEIIKVEWANGEEKTTWGEDAIMASTTTTVKATPYMHGLKEISISPTSDKQVRLTFEIGGRETFEYRTPSQPTPAALLSGPTNGNKTDELAKLYSLPTTPKAEKVCRWHSKINRMVEGHEVKESIVNFGYSEPRNPFQFSAYGNEVDGFFYTGQRIISIVEYQTRTDANTRESVHKYTGSLIPIDGTPDIKIESYGKHGKYTSGQSIIGTIGLIRSATKEEFKTEGAGIIISLVNTSDLNGVIESAQTEIIAAPRRINTIAEAIQEKVKRHAS